MIKQILFTRIYKIKLAFTRRKINKYDKIYSLSQISHYLKSRNEKYNYFYHFFWNLSPKWLKEHRAYFSQNFRGFGEDAFHAMWFFVFKKFKPKYILEIGIYRGQTLSLFSLLGKKFEFEVDIHGISPFTSAGDKVSQYLGNLDYYKDVMINFDFFKLPLPVLHKGFSTDEDMIKVIKSKVWDLIYIDGNHDYEIVKQDFNICADSIKKGGLLVLDDASLNTDYTPSFYSTAGHPGPSFVASEINLDLFEEILSVGHNRVFMKL
ncbi:class I SAM-dependent methyltransferase [Flavobacterium ajazii]|uniref:class I SAM-dependent methyltransferase n=1 Tax=Flavobacterium ajazii TaxID=2692318 RepID=UPI0013D75136|nr:class I SAM-dependent methyltransferase [Flavobacterium ajazii]